MPSASPPVERARELLPAGTPTPSGRNDLPARPRASVLRSAAGPQPVTSRSRGADVPTLVIDRPAVHPALAPRVGWAGSVDPSSDGLPSLADSYAAALPCSRSTRSAVRVPSQNAPPSGPPLLPPPRSGGRT